jgi:hypothetical protein
VFLAAYLELVIFIVEATVDYHFSRAKYLISDVKNKTIPVTGRGDLNGCEMLSIPHCLDIQLTVNCEILATCSSTYSTVRSSQDAHSVSIK